MLLVAAGVGALAGCSGGAAPGPSDGGLTSISIISSPVVDGAPIFYAATNGLFEECGLDVDVKQVVAGGPAMIPQLLNGDIQFGATGPGTVIPVWRQDLPVKLVAPLSIGATDIDNATDRLIARADSGIDSLDDLPGKTIAVPTINNMGQISIGAMLDEAGIDPASVKYTVVPFPEQQAAFESGAIDLAFSTEPFITLISDVIDINILGAPGLAIAPGIPNFMVVGLDSYVEQNPDVVRCLQSGISEAIDFLSANPEDARTFAGTFTNIDPAALASMKMPTFSNEINAKGLQATADAALKFGIIDAPITVADQVIPYPLP